MRRPIIVHDMNL